MKFFFTSEMKRQAPGFLLLQYSTNGAPDRSILGMGLQSNWEFKHGTPDFESPGDQELVCCRIAARAHCRYVIWQEIGDLQKTMIVHPNHIRNRTSYRGFTVEDFCIGFDMRWLVSKVMEAHR